MSAYANGNGQVNRVVGPQSATKAAGRDEIGP